MRTPLWMVNSILILLGFIVMGFILLTQVKVPIPAPIAPNPAAIVLPKKEFSKPQLNRIYNNDLFDTYIQPSKPTVAPLEKPQLPQPPQPKQYTPTSKPAPTFLEPLKIILKGVIWQGNEEDSRAIVADQTGKQKVYRVGDKIEDSYVLHIFERKMILLRSNGQQEVLYVNQDEALRDREKEALRKQDYTNIIQPINGTTYQIDPEQFTQVIHNLGQLIDVLHLSTVYKNGQPVGVRLGAFDNGTLGSALGLKENDVILTINNIDATDIKNRLAIYQSIIEHKDDSPITVSILRNGAQIMRYYTLQTISPEPPQSQQVIEEDTFIQTQIKPSPLYQPPTQEEIAEKKKKILDDSQKLVPMKIDMKKEDKRAMLKKGARQPLFKTIT